MKIIGIYNELHPGITMHKIPVKSGFPGVLFTLGMMAVYLMGIRDLIYFLVSAVVLGIGVAVMLRFIPRQAGLVMFVLTAVMLVWLVGPAFMDDWRQEHEIPPNEFLPPTMAPPSPPGSELSFRCDCDQRKPRQPCDSTTRSRSRTEQRHATSGRAPLSAKLTSRMDANLQRAIGH